MILLFSSGLLFITAYFAGILGALTGLGGGVVIIPVLVLLLHVNIYYAMGASLLSVIATSSGTAMTYLKTGYTNLRIGIFLETAAVMGALLGAALILVFNSSKIAIVFGVILIVSAYLTWTHKEAVGPPKPSHPWAVKMKLGGICPSKKGTEMKPYTVQNVPLAWFILLVAGALSSLLGIGSGALKVLAMDQAMKLPYKVSTATSNFMIGITAAVSAGIYFSRGYIDPVLSFPVVLGVLLGSISGGKLLHRINTHYLRIVFSIVIVFLGIQMIIKGFGGAV